jgi:predicted acetyltransferase
MTSNTKIEIRPARPDEMSQFGLIGAYVYAGAFGDGPDNVVAQSNLPEWTLCAFVDGRMATSYSCIPFTMRANGRAVSLGGVSAVGTLPEHRRLGLLRAITTRSFEEMRARGQSVASLWASQAAIYQRYGYALASSAVTYRVDSVDVGFYDGDRGSARVDRVRVDDAFDVMKQLYIEFVKDRTCYLHRAKPLWLANTLSSNALTGPVHVAVAYAADESPIGYVAYHVRSGDPATAHRTRGQVLTVKDFVWLNMDAYRSLWSWLGRHDLVGRIVWPRAPTDDPASEVFVEPRLLHPEWRDGTWLRVIDARAALETRGYTSSGAITLEITADTMAPWNAGKLELECSLEGARTVTTRKTADLTLTSKALASLYTGFRTPQQLVAWGLAQGDDTAVERATRIFATRHAPHCPDNF